MAEVPAPVSTKSPGSAGPPRQNRAYGRFLLILSWAMRLVGGLAAGIGVAGSRNAYVEAHDPGYQGPGWVVLLLFYVAIVPLGVLLFGAGVKAGRRARRHLVRVITSAADLASGSYVLYLRPFEQDGPASGIDSGDSVLPEEVILRPGRTHEERLAKMFRRFGPMVTVGRPGEELPAGSGAYRLYLPREDWQDPVRGLIDGARVILVGAGPGPGTIWEYVEILRRARHHRLVLLVTDPEWYLQFMKLTAARLRTEMPGLTRLFGDQWQPPALPSLPSPGRPKRKETFYFRAMICFGPGWEASLTSFDRSAMDSLRSAKYVKKRLKPVLAHLRTAGATEPALVRRPPARPVPGPFPGAALPARQPPLPPGRRDAFPAGPDSLFREP